MSEWYDDIAVRLRKAINAYEDLGIVRHLDYAKYSLYSLITHSTAIEGSTVTEVENQLLFDQGITAQGRTLAEQLMNLDLKAAYEQSLAWAKVHEPISVEALCQLAALVMKRTGSVYHTPLGDFDASRGDLRLLNVTAGPGGRSYMDYHKVPTRLEAFCHDINERRQSLRGQADHLLPGYLLSLDAHYGLVTIHPWADGNGRMARLLMNQLQWEMGLVPIRVDRTARQPYIQSLIDAREAESPAPFHRFMLTHHIANLQKEIATCHKDLWLD